MYIKKMHVDSFGILADQEASLSPGLNVFLGHNEAGKSTCLKFFRAMLFGYKRRRSSIEPLIQGSGKRLGGGSLHCFTETLGEIVLTRRPGPGPGPLSLLGPDGGQLPDTALGRLFPGLDVEVFDNIFAFTLKDLMDLGSLSGEGVRHALHGAAFGLGNRSPAQLLKSLDNRMRELLKQGLGSGKINNLLKSLEEADNALAEHGAVLEQYESLKRDMDLAGAGLEELRLRQRELEQERRALERRLGVWPVWEKLALLNAEKEVLLSRAATLKDNRFSTDSRERLEALLAKKEEQSLSLAAEQEALARLHGELEALEARPDLLEMEPAVQSLLEQKQAREEEARLIPRLLHQAAQLASEQRDILKHFGPEWSRDKAFATDCSLFAKDHIRHMRNGMTSLAEEARRARAVFEQIAEERRSEARGLEEAEAGKEGRGGPALPDAAFLQTVFAEHARAKAVLRELPLLTARQEEAEKELQAALGAISPNWDQDRLRDFDLSLSGHQAMRDKARNLIALRLEYENCWKERALADRDLGRAHREVKEAGEKLAACANGADLAELNERQSLLRRLEKTWHAYEAARREHAQANELVTEHVAPREGRAGSWRKGPLAVSALLGAGCAGLYAAGFLLDVLYFAPALSLLVLSGIFLVAAMGGDKGRQRRDDDISPLLKARSRAAREMEAAAGEMAGLLAGAAFWLQSGVSGPDGLSQAFFDRWRDVLDRQTRQAILRERDEAELQKARKLLDEATLACDRIEEAGMAVRERMDQAEAAWREFLEETGLGPSLGPESCDSLFHMVSAAETKAGAAVSQAKARRGAEHFIKSCLERAAGHEFFAPFIPDASALDLSGLEKALSEAARLREEAAKEETSGRIMEDRKARLATLKKREDEALARSVGAGRALAEEEEAWRSWLVAQGLSESLTPESAAEALALLESYTAKDKERLELAERARSLGQALGAYVRQAGELLLAAGLTLPEGFSLREREAVPLPAAQETLPGLPGLSVDQKQLPRGREVVLADLPEVLLPRVLPVLDRLRRDVRRAEEAVSLAREKRDQIKEREQGLNRAQRALEATQRAVDDLLAAGGVKDPESFRQAFSLWQQVSGLEAGEASLRIQLANAAGEEGLEAEELGAALESMGREGLEERLARVGGELAGLEAEVQAGAEARGQMQAGLEALMNDEEAADWRSRRASVLEELSEGARQWSVLALARHTLLKAKERFEREGQSGVIKHAGELMRAITDGRYTGLSAPLGEEAFFVIDRNGNLMDPEKTLSQGTREQLYLSLRLAYVRNHADKAEAVPVVMDEVLVNFDPSRMRRAARVLAEFARDNQVLFFSCHPGTADILMSEARAVHGQGGPEPMEIVISGGVISSERT